MGGLWHDLSMPRKSAYNATALEPLLRMQDQVVSRSQALRCGVTPAAIRQRTEFSRPWRRLLPGVYLTATGRATPDQLQVAALLYAGGGSMLTGTSALRRLGVRVPPRDRLLVLVPAGRRRRSTSFVTIWPTTRMPDSYLSEGVIRMAPPDRAAADAARELTRHADVRAVVADAVQKRLCTPDRLARELRAGPRRGSAALRDVLAEVAAGARSIAEAELLQLVTAARLPTPLCNPNLYAGSAFIARPDMWWPDAGVAVEVDSREWHLLPEHAEQTTRRHNLMGVHGIIVLHFTPRQIREEPERIIEQIRAALAKGLARPRLPLHTRPAI